MSTYCEFEFSSLTIGEWKSILDVVSHFDDISAQELSKLVEVIQNHTNTDIMSLPLSDLNDVTRQFGLQFTEYVEDMKL